MLTEKHSSYLKDKDEEPLPWISPIHIIGEVA